MPIADSLKYLGMIISYNKEDMFKIVKKSLTQRVNHCRHKVAKLNGKIQMKVLMTYLLSVAEYQLGPLTKAKVIQESAADQLRV